MTSNAQLDLQGIAWPMCLLQFKQNLLALVAGEMLEVLIQDPEVAEQITTIVSRSQDRLIIRQKDGKRVRLRIMKGEYPDDSLPIVPQSIQRQCDS
ncbi:MAG TPA: sulfurtransferase TusA family protein [Thermodesulfobacteriota bacterium]|nr:sulfurtransferase TusA family protein [Thermodesulfobacteriota bacterium]